MNVFALKRRGPISWVLNFVSADGLMLSDNLIQQDCLSDT